MRSNERSSEAETRTYTEQDVIAKYGRGLPTYRKIRRQTGYKRTFDKTDRAEMDAVRDWLVHDNGFLRLVDTYACYCRILANRGYGSVDDIQTIRSDHPGLVARLADNVAKFEVSYVWHDLLDSTHAIMHGEGGDGYWPFLDKAYLDISNMTVGKAIINLDEVWAVVYGTLKALIDKFVERERQMKGYSCYYCDRCGAAIYDGRQARFDPYENLLHCATCAKVCYHWKGRRK